VDGVVDCDRSTNSDDGRNKYNKELEADPQTQAKPADVFLAKLIAQVGNSQGVFVLEVLFLHLQELRLLAEELLRLPSDSGIIPGQFCGDGQGPLEPLLPGSRPRPRGFRRASL